MNALYKYDISSECKLVFENLINKFSFNILESDERKFVIANKAVKLIIKQDPEKLLYFSIVDNKTGNYYDILKMFEMRNINIGEENTIFKNIATGIESHLSDVLLGNFSWREEYQEVEILFKKLWDLKHNDLVYLKYLNRDFSWKRDIKE